MGTTGPNSLNLRQTRYMVLVFLRFPPKDMVELQVELVNSLGIDRLFCVVGGSMGGMQVLEWGINYSNRVTINSYCYLLQTYGTNIAFHESRKASNKS